MAELEQDDGEKKKLPKKLIIIIVAAVVLLAAIGGGAFFLLKEDSPKKDKAGEEAAAVPAEKVYYDMAKPLIVDFPKGSLAKHGRITVTMFVEGAETLNIVRTNEPMIRNNLLMLIGAQDSNQLNTHEGKEALRKLMLDEVNAVIIKMAGKGQVLEMFFTSFVMQ